MLSKILHKQCGVGGGGGPLIRADANVHEGAVRALGAERGAVQGYATVHDNVGIERGAINVNICNYGMSSMVMLISFSMFMMNANSNSNFIFMMNVDLASPYPWLFLTVLVIAGLVYKIFSNHGAQNGQKTLAVPSDKKGSESYLPCFFWKNLCRERRSLSALIR